jgi:intracellular multiplication protein IcmK
MTQAIAQNADTRPSALLPPQSRQPQLQQMSDPSGYGQTARQQSQHQSQHPNSRSAHDQQLPLIGADKLLESLDDLDRPLTPEQATAYGAAVQSNLPMTPEMIRDYRRRVDEAERAASEPPSGKEPRLVSDAIRMSLKPESAVSVIATAPNTVSVVSFYDRTGKAWPVASYVVGRADLFQVFALQEGSNKLSVSALKLHGYTNVIVSLVEESRPIILNLQTSQDTAIARRDITIEAYGPNAAVNPTTISEKVAPGDKVMMSFVQGAGLPHGAVQLNSSDSDTDVWAYKGDYYVRTSDTLISPSWSSVLTGPGGIHAYRIKQTPVALVSKNGTVERVRISN